MKLPINETRKFKSGELNNSIKYTIIYDEYAEKASMATAVNTGSYFDPENYDGLAHFLEHMLFLGSKKYPNEDEFDSTLKANGGYSNAYTDNFETVYYFTVNTEMLEKSIDMFSRFFIDPLFDKNSVEREVNAVNSEHSKNINQNWWRINYITNLISKHNSQINKFSTGNLQTLKKKGVREKMKELIDQSSDAINNMMALAAESEHPRAFEVLSNMIKHTADMTQDLVKLQKTRKEITNHLLF